MESKDSKGRPRSPKPKEVINVSIDAELKNAAREMARASNRSISNWLETVIAELWRNFNKK